MFVYVAAAVAADPALTETTRLRLNSACLVLALSASMAVYSTRYTRSAAAGWGREAGSRCSSVMSDELHMGDQAKPQGLAA